MMGIEFERIVGAECVLCGASECLTGEHKIKASLIRAEFGKRAALFSGKDGLKIAQSPKSRQYHFKSKICQTCNSSSTQGGDRAFDLLHCRMKCLHDAGSDLTNASGSPNGTFSSDAKLDYFRYFSKILCLFLAESGGPRSKTLSSFALGISSHNPVFLKISRDENYEAARAMLGTQGFAEHGGLKFRFDSKERWVQSLESSLSIGGIRYDFWAKLGWLPKLELRLSFPELIQVALENIAED